MVPGGNGVAVSALARTLEISSPPTEHELVSVARESILGGSILLMYHVRSLLRGQRLTYLNADIRIGRVVKINKVQSISGGKEDTAWFNTHGEWPRNRRSPFRYWKGSILPRIMWMKDQLSISIIKLTFHPWIVCSTDIP